MSEEPVDIWSTFDAQTKEEIINLFGMYAVRYIEAILKDQKLSTALKDSQITPTDPVLDQETPNASTPAPIPSPGDTREYQTAQSSSQGKKLRTVKRHIHSAHHCKIRLSPDDDSNLPF